MEPVGFLVGAGVAAVGYAFAYRRRGQIATVRLGARRLELFTPGEPAAVFAAIAAIGSPYRVDDADPAQRMLVLSSRPSIWSYGFLYPVSVHADGTGSRIELGVTSRLFHLGPGMGHAHVACAKAIEALLTVPPARQVT